MIAAALILVGAVMGVAFLAAALVWQPAEKRGQS